MAPRINIYVPADLAEEVREAHLNVSQIAQEALRSALQRRALTKDARTVAARLRGTLDEEERREHERWFALGREWAETVATAGELRNMAELSREGWFRWSVPEDHSIRGFLADDAGWKPDFAGDLERDANIDGFIDGALAVWSKVEAEVYGGDA